MKCRVHDSWPAEENANSRRVGLRKRKVGSQSDGSKQPGTQSIDDRGGLSLVCKTTDGSTVAAVAGVTHDQHIVLSSCRIFISYVRIISISITIIVIVISSFSYNKKVSGAKKKSYCYEQIHTSVHFQTKNNTMRIFINTTWAIYSMNQNNPNDCRPQ